MVICYTANKTHAHNYGSVFSCGSISRDLGTNYWYQEARCRECVLAGADIAGIVAVKPTVAVVAFLFPAFTL